MKTTVKSFADKFRLIVGDSSLSVPDQFIIASLNWAFNSLPSVSKLYLAWSEHNTMQLDAKEHYQWEIPTKFRDVVKFAYMNFFTTTGGVQCPLPICYRSTIPFYKKNGIIEHKVSGTPCEYTREKEDDKTYLILDRPSNIPIMVDYICYGRPTPVTSMEDEVEMPGVVENLILSAMRRVFYQESSDFAFAADITSYLDNKEVVEAVQELTRKDSDDTFRILGEAIL